MIIQNDDDGSGGGGDVDDKAYDWRQEKNANEAFMHILILYVLYVIAYDDRSIFTTSINVLFDLPLFLERQSTYIEKRFFTGTIAGLCGTCPNHSYLVRCLDL